VTIAVGFRHKDGILLCADTQQEGAVTKFYGPKVGYADIAYGQISCAFAGNSVFAATTIQACIDTARTAQPKKVVAVLKRVIDEEYRRLVLTHPEYSTDPNIGFSLLVALWSKDKQSTSMWVTNENALQSCFAFVQPIGLGAELANVLVRPFYADELSEDGALTLAAYTLAMVKANVSGCGGYSNFVSMRNDGGVKVVLDMTLDRIEEMAAGYDKAAHELLFAMSDGDATVFEQKVAQFVSNVRQARVGLSSLRLMSTK
jgi:hypothetical protein